MVLSVRSSNPGSSKESFHDQLFVCSAISIRGKDKIANLEVHIYSIHPNTEPPSVFGCNLMPVPDIRPVISLDRFGMNKIFSLL